MFALGKRRDTCVHRGGPGLALVLALSLGWAALPAPAQACSRGLSAIAVSYPAAYAEDVPTNVVLFADGPELDSLSFVLSDDRGGSIPIQVRAVAAGGFDIEPSAELAPHQTYVLTGAHALEG